VLQLFQQFTGINLFIQFLGSMFGQQLGYADQTALLLAACCATWFFITSIISVVGIDQYFGRRTLTMFGASGMCACMIVLCGMSYLSTQSSHHAMSAFLFLYVAFFSIGWQGMGWLWAVELVPLSIRGPANALVSVNLHLLQQSRTTLTIHTVYCRQLARQLLRRHHLPSDVHADHLQDLRNLRRHQLCHRPLDLLLLP